MLDENDPMDDGNEVDPIARYAAVVADKTVKAVSADLDFRRANVSSTVEKSDSLQKKVERKDMAVRNVVLYFAVEGVKDDRAVSAVGMAPAIFVANARHAALPRGVVTLLRFKHATKNGRLF